MPVVNEYGRPWGELDALRARVNIAGAFSLASADGVPLCGRVVEGTEPVRLVALNWKQQAA